jgi:transposase
MHYGGFDVSHEWIDLALLDGSGKLVHQQRVENQRKAIRKLIRALVKSHGVILEKCLFCLEPTGHYSYAVLEILVDMKVPTWPAHPFHIKQTTADMRGKSDELDALRIAQYAYRYQDQMRLITPDQLKLTELKNLLMKREQLIKERTKTKIQLSHVNKHMRSLQKTFDSIDNAVNKVLEKQLARVDKLIEDWIAAQPKIHEQFELMCSIPGIGKVLASTLLAGTDGFIRFTSAKALACHCGVAPFEYTSGSSIKGRNRTSPRANPTLRSLLHMAALSAVRLDPGLKAYYERKVAQGKSKMSVLNAVGGKLIDRIYAVLRRGTPYLKTPIASEVA